MVLGAAPFVVEKMLAESVSEIYAAAIYFLPAIFSSLKGAFCRSNLLTWRSSDFGRQLVDYTHKHCAEWEDPSVRCRHRLVGDTDRRSSAGGAELASFGLLPG
jgi:hypothetical protein